MPTILMTGAAGKIGGMLRTRLARPGAGAAAAGHRPADGGRRGEEALQASVTDLDVLITAFDGADAVIHLAGVAGERAWEAGWNTSTSTARGRCSRRRAGPG